jgi:hypothetical protein
MWMLSISVGIVRSLHTTTTIRVLLSWLEQAPARFPSRAKVQRARRMAT